jgi:hypothetical protein
MKSLVTLACFITLLFGQPLLAADALKQAAPVRLAISNDLVKDFPIQVTATTTEDKMGFTLGPKADGGYCTLDAQIVRLEDGSAKITVSFAEETKLMLPDGSSSWRSVGFSDLSIILSPGQEETLFSSGDKKFILKLLKARK